MELGGKTAMAAGRKSMLNSLAARIALLKQLRQGNLGDVLFQLLALLFGLSILALMFGIVFETWSQSAPSRWEFGWGFLWSIAFDPPNDRVGALPFIYGTLASSVLAILIAGPIGIGIAAYLVEIAPRRLNQVVGFVVELLAAVPSIVFGLWGIIVLAPWMKNYIVPPLQAVLGWTPLFRGTFFGPSVFAAGVVLAIMILPTVAAVSREVIRAVPDAQREGMLALGATRWEMFSRAVLPYGKSGITGAVILGLGRAAGETMAVTLIIGNSPRIFTSLFDQGATMASIIANNFAESRGLFLSSLIEIGLILFAVTFLINVGARLLVSLISKQPQGGIRA
jgi:phosphate transport system permease protein